MKASGLACALGVVVLATSAYAKDVIVFVNGSRMEVERYEISPSWREPLCSPVSAPPVNRRDD